MFDWPPDGRAGLGFFAFAGFLALSFLAAFLAAFFLAMNLNFLGGWTDTISELLDVCDPEVSGHTNGAVITAGYLWLVDLSQTWTAPSYHRELEQGRWGMAGAWPASTVVANYGFSEACKHRRELRGTRRVWGSQTDGEPLPGQLFNYLETYRP